MARSERAGRGPQALLVILLVLHSDIIGVMFAVAAATTVRAPSLAARSRSLCAARPSLLRAPSCRGPLHQSPACALWSSSLSFCLSPVRRSTCPLSSSAAFCSSPSPLPKMAAAAVTTISPASVDSNPLLKDFDFPPFDVVRAEDVVPGVRELLGRLVRAPYSYFSRRSARRVMMSGLNHLQEVELSELERSVRPTWPDLVEPLEKIVDRLQVVWGIVNHLKAVKDSPELRAAIEEVQVRLDFLSCNWVV